MKQIKINNKLRAEYSKNITKQILQLSCVKEAKCIALFYSMENEFDTSFLIQQLQHKQLVFPVIQNDTMYFMTADELEIGQYGITQPKKGIIPKKIDVMIVPCLGYNKQGYRIGYGKGFYDRYLLNNPVKTILPALPTYCVEFIPEVHDIKMDILIQP